MEETLRDRRLRERILNHNSSSKNSMENDAKDQFQNYYNKEMKIKGGEKDYYPPSAPSENYHYPTYVLDENDKRPSSTSNHPSRPPFDENFYKSSGRPNSEQTSHMYKQSNSLRTRIGVVPGLNNVSTVAQDASKGFGRGLSTLNGSPMTQVEKQKVAKANDYKAQLVAQMEFNAKKKALEKQKNMYEDRQYDNTVLPLSNNVNVNNHYPPYASSRPSSISNNLGVHERGNLYPDFTPPPNTFSNNSYETHEMNNRTVSPPSHHHVNAPLFEDMVAAELERQRNTPRETQRVQGEEIHSYNNNAVPESEWNKFNNIGKERSNSREVYSHHVENHGKEERSNLYSREVYSHPVENHDNPDHYYERPIEKVTAPPPSVPTPSANGNFGRYRFDINNPEKQAELFRKQKKQLAMAEDLQKQIDLNNLEKKRLKDLQKELDDRDSERLKKELEDMQNKFKREIHNEDRKNNPTTAVLPPPAVPSTVNESFFSPVTNKVASPTFKSTDVFQDSRDRGMVENDRNKSFANDERHEDYNYAPSFSNNREVGELNILVQQMQRQREEMDNMLRHQSEMMRVLHMEALAARNERNDAIRNIQMLNNNSRDEEVIRSSSNSLHQPNSARPMYNGIPRSGGAVRMKDDKGRFKNDGSRTSRESRKWERQSGDDERGGVTDRSYRSVDRGDRGSFSELGGESTFVNYTSRSGRSSYTNSPAARDGREKNNIFDEERSLNGESRFVRAEESWASSPLDKSLQGESLLVYLSPEEIMQQLSASSSRPFSIENSPNRADLKNDFVNDRNEIDDEVVFKEEESGKEIGKVRKIYIPQLNLAALKSDNEILSRPSSNKGVFVGTMEDDESEEERETLREMKKKVIIGSPNPFKKPVKVNRKLRSSLPQVNLEKEKEEENEDVVEKAKLQEEEEVFGDSSFAVHTVKGYNVESLKDTALVEDSDSEEGPPYSMDESFASDEPLRDTMNTSVLISKGKSVRGNPLRQSSAKIKEALRKSKAEVENEDENDISRESATSNSTSYVSSAHQSVSKPLSPMIKQAAQASHFYNKRIKVPKNL